MSKARWIGMAHGLLLNAACKRAWGQSVEVFDPGSLVEELRPAITDAVGAAGDREAVASTLLDLYRTYTGSRSDSVSMIFRACMSTGSNTLHVACENAIREAGPAVLEVLREALGDETDEDAVVEFLFDACQSAVDAIRDPANRLDALQNAYRRARNVTDDPDILEALADGLRVAGRHGEHRASEILFEYYRDEAALGMSSDPWPLLEELITSLQTGHAGVLSDEEASDVLMRTLRDAIADEGGASLWEGYQHRLYEMDEFEGLENAEALLEAHARLIRAGADTRWLVDKVCEVCVDIAHARDDVSYLLPDRLQVSDACLATMRTVMTSADVRDELFRAFESAVPTSGDPWGVLSKAYRKILTKADSRAEQLIADILIRASCEAVENALSAAWISARRVGEDRERIVDLVLKLNATRSESDAHLGSDQSPSERLEALLRTLEVSAAALSDPTAAADLMAFVVRETSGTSYGEGIDHMMSAFEEALSALGNPEAETDLMYEAYVDAILDDNDPGGAVETLVHGAREAIAKAEDPDGAIEVFLDGLSVEPAGWPPPTPPWLIPE